jgi:glycosyltransferase involved in cell wall biosynthesis
MRIAFLTSSAGLGGAERLLLNLIHSLRAASPGIELHLLAPTDGPLLDRAGASSVIPHIVPMPSSLGRIGESHLRGLRTNDWWRLAGGSVAMLPAVGTYMYALRSTLDRIRPDIVHSNGIKSHLASVMAVPRGAIVWHAHDFLSVRPLTTRLLRLAAGRSVGIIAVSDAVARDARRLLPRCSVVTIPNAIDLAEFTPETAPADLDRLAGLPPADGAVLRVGLVATYALWKGHEVFLQAAAQVAKQRPELPVRFFVIGGPIYQTRAQWSEDALRRIAGQFGLDSHVGFVPFQPNPAAAYRALDVVVHASTLPEPFGLTIAEAMASGRAVIVSRTGGAAELFTDGRDAIGVPPGDVAALTAAIIRLVCDAGLRQQLGRQAHDTALHRFDRARLGPEVLRAYAEFRSRRPRAVGGWSPPTKPAAPHRRQTILRHLAQGSLASAGPRTSRPAFRIAFLSTSGALGGAERSLLNVMESLRATAPNVQPVVVAFSDGPLVRAAAENGVQTRVVPLPRRWATLGESGPRDPLGRIPSVVVDSILAGVPSLWRYCRTLRAALSDLAPDVLHSNGLKSHLLAVAAAPPHVPVVWHVRDYIPLRPIAKLLLRLARRRSSGAIAISQSVALSIRETFRGFPVATVPNGIDLMHFSPHRTLNDTGRAKLDSGEARPLQVGLVATFARWKGHEVFLRAAAHLIARRPELAIQFSIIGGPIYETAGSQYSIEELERLVTDLGVTGRVTFTGFLTDPASAYHDLDIVVHASTLPEPFGLTIAEAMASGRAVIVSQTGGAAELFTEGFDAVGVPPGDAAALSVAIERLADVAALRERLGRQARKTAVERFDRRRLGPDILRAYASFRRS